MGKISLIRHQHTESHKSGAKASVCDIATRHPKADVVVIEDHVSLGKEDAVCEVGAKVLQGAEWYARASIGVQHMGIVGVSRERGRRIQPGVSIPKLAQQVHDAGGWLVMNHLDYKRNPRKYKITDEEALAIDAVEVFNDRGVSAEGNDPEASLEFMKRNFYDRGRTAAVVSGADEHGPDTLAKRLSYTIVLADDVLSGIRAGATYVSQDPDLDLLRFDIDGQVRLGEAPIEVARGSTHKLSGKIDDLPVGGRIVVVVNGRDAQSFAISKSETAFEHPFISGQGDRTYVYLKIYDASGRLHMATSTLWLTHPDLGR